MAKNYNFITMTAGVIIALAVAIPFLIFGIGAVIKSFQVMFSPVLSTGIPIWAIFVIGIIVLILLRRRR